MQDFLAARQAGVLALLADPVQWLALAAGVLASGLVIGSAFVKTNGSSVGLSYIDESDVQFTEFFEVNAAGTQAVGSGSFTVRQQCPIASCLWLDSWEPKAPGGGSAGYGGADSLVASVTPEPGTYGLMALGLVAVGAAARRRRAMTRITKG